MENILLQLIEILKYLPKFNHIWQNLTSSMNVKPYSTTPNNIHQYPTISSKILCLLGKVSKTQLMYTWCPIYQKIYQFTENLVQRGCCIRSPLVTKLFEVVLLHEDVTQLEQKKSRPWYTCGLSPHRVSAM